jgi:sulfhydrogenase subunit alpha
VISSHALHVYFLAAPDFLGVESVMPLVQEDPDTVRRAFRLKKGGYELGELVAGRHPHPVSVTTGGFTSLPKPAEFEEMRDRLVSLRDDIEATVELFKSVEIPQFERPTEYVCLRQPDHYAFYEGEIVSSEGEAIPVDAYEEVLREYVVAHSTAKHVRWHRDSYMVGALARVNNNWGQLVPEAQDAMKELGLAPPCHNPFMNTVAQVVELVHCLEESVGA